MDEQEYKLKNPLVLASTLVKGLHQVSDGKIARIAEAYIWMLIVNAPEVWDEFLDKAKFFLDGQVEVNRMYPVNQPDNLYLCLKSAVESMLDQGKRRALPNQSPWEPEKTLFYVILGEFDTQDWKAFGAFLEVEPV